MRYLNKQLVLNKEPIVNYKPLFPDSGTIISVTCLKGTVRHFVFSQISTGIYKIFDVNNVTNRYTDIEFKYQHDALPPLKAYFQECLIEEFKE